MEPRFLCRACWRSAALRPGPCRRCGVARAPFDAGARVALHERAERRLDRRQLAEDLAAWSCAVVLALAAYGLWLGHGAPPPDARPLFGRHRLLALLIAIFGVGLQRVYPRLLPWSARAQRASHRVRPPAGLELLGLARVDLDA